MTDDVANPFVQSMSSNFERALRLWTRRTPTRPNRVFTRAELLRYSSTAAVVCAERSTRSRWMRRRGPSRMPIDTHGLVHGVLIGSLPLHVVEHLAQIRQFLTAAGVSVRAMPGDRGDAGMSTA